LILSRRARRSSASGRSRLVDGASVAIAVRSPRPPSTTCAEQEVRRATAYFARREPMASTRGYDQHTTGRMVRDSVWD
jgi:hypothetical protein